MRLRIYLTAIGFALCRPVTEAYETATQMSSPDWALARRV